MDNALTSGTSLPAEHLSCPECSADVPCYDAKNSTYFACGNCGAFFVKQGSSPARAIMKFRPEAVCIPGIPLGSQGVFEGQTFTVVGFMLKRDPEEDVYWREYVLFNPGLPNYHILAEYDGHWTLVWQKELKEYREYDLGYYGEHKIEIRSYERRFRHYVTYKFEIPWAKGEFDWDIIDDTSSMVVSEYVDAPNMIVSEAKNGEQEWYWGQYYDRQQIADAFGMRKKDLPGKIGMHVLEMPKYIQQWPPLKRFTLLILGLLFVTQFMMFFIKTPEKIFEADYVTVKDTASWAAIKPIVSAPFEIKSTGAVNLTVRAGVDNDWMEMAVSLVNNSTGETYDVTKVIEWYHGYEGGESWSEGGVTEDAVISNVPAGTYHLNIYPYSDSQKPEYNVGVSVEQNSICYSNFIWILLALLIYPWITYQRKRARANNFFF